jgi:hypothetical protein
LQSFFLRKQICFEFIASSEDKCKYVTNDKRRKVGKKKETRKLQEKQAKLTERKTKSRTKIQKKIKKIIPEANYDNEAKKLKRKINDKPSSCGLQKM